MEEAHNQYIVGNVAKAIEGYTKLIETQPTLFDSYLYRAIAYIESGNYDAAITDLAKADQIKSGMFQIHFRWGIALFYKQQFAQSLSSFKTAETLAKEGFEKQFISLWIQKCLREQGNMSAAALNASGMIPSSGKPTSVPAEVPKEELKTVVAAEQEKKLEYEWYQTVSHVNMVLKVKGATKDKCVVVFAAQEITFSMKLEEGKTFEHSYNLHMEIVPEQCSYVVTETKVELKMKKKQDGISWPSLEKTEQKPITEKPSYPTSAKKKVDWDQLDKEITRESAKEKPEGDEAMNSLFKAIYE